MSDETRVDGALDSPADADSASPPWTVSACMQHIFAYCIFAIFLETLKLFLSNFQTKTCCTSHLQISRVIVTSLRYKSAQSCDWLSRSVWKHLSSSAMLHCLFTDTARLSLTHHQVLRWEIATVMFMFMFAEYESLFSFAHDSTQELCLQISGLWNQNQSQENNIFVIIMYLPAADTTLGLTCADLPLLEKEPLQHNHWHFVCNAPLVWLPCAVSWFCCPGTWHWFFSGGKRGRGGCKLSSSVPLFILLSRCDGAGWVETIQPGETRRLWHTVSCPMCAQEWWRRQVLVVLC